MATEISVCAPIATLAQGASGMTSVGLKAVALVKPRYRSSTKRGRQPGGASSGLSCWEGEAGVPAQPVGALRRAEALQG